MIKEKVTSKEELHLIRNFISSDFPELANKIVDLQIKLMTAPITKDGQASECRGRFIKDLIDIWHRLIRINNRHCNETYALIRIIERKETTNE